MPQDNGGHERVHRTFKREAIKPVRHTCRQQQPNFDGFQREYNTERPHEALSQETPRSRYHLSPRRNLDRLPPLERPGHFLVKKITTGGTFRFQHDLLYLASASSTRLFTAWRGDSGPPPTAGDEKSDPGSEDDCPRDR